eukprot:gene7358-506_t
MSDRKGSQSLSSACSNFESHRARPNICRNCKKPKNKHGNSILDSPTSGEIAIAKTDIQSEGLPKRTGMLKKAGEFNKSYQTRYFVLNDCRLEYYKESTDKKPAGDIDLKIATDVLVINPTAQMEIKTPSRVWKLMANSHSDACNWVKDIKAHCPNIYDSQAGRSNSISNQAFSDTDSIEMSSRLNRSSNEESDRSKIAASSNRDISAALKNVAVANTFVEENEEARRAQEEAEKRAKEEEEARHAQEEAEKRAQEEAEVRHAQEEAEKRAKEEAEARHAQEEAEKRAQEEAEARHAQEEAEKRAKEEAEARHAQEEAEKRAQEEEE